MKTNPSKEWTSQERLQVIAEHVANAMNNRLITNPRRWRNAGGDFFCPNSI